MTYPFEQTIMTRTELKQYVKDNPDEPVAETVSKFGVTKQNVYNARHAAGVSVPTAKPKRSPKAGLRVIRKKTLTDKDHRIAELEKQIEMLKISPNQEVRYVATPDQVSAVRRLEAELLDAKAIIAYLERKLNGTPV
jgi:hypothetical protein